MSGWREVCHAEPGLGAWHSSAEGWLVHVQVQKVVESAMPAGRTVSTVGSGAEVASEVGEQKGSQPILTEPVASREPRHCLLERHYSGHVYHQIASFFCAFFSVIIWSSTKTTNGTQRE